MWCNTYWKETSSQATMHLARRSKIVSWDGIISRDDFNDHLMEMFSDHLTETNSDETLNRTLKRWSIVISWRCCVSSPWDVSQTSHGDGRVFVSWDNIKIISRDFDVHLMEMMMKISRDDCVFVSWDDVGIISMRSWLNIWWIWWSTSHEMIFLSKLRQLLRR